jgi:integrase
LLTVTTEIAMRKLFPPMIKMSEIRITLMYLNRMKLKRFFRYRGLFLELVNEINKGDFINIALLLLDAFACLFTGARVNELAQLRLDDIQEDDGVYF